MNYKNKKVKIVGNSTNHMWKKGHIVVIVQELNNGYNYCDCGGTVPLCDDCDCDEDDNYFRQYQARDPKTHQIQTIGHNDFVLVNMDITEIKNIIVNIEKSINKKRKEIDNWNEKIEYLNESGAETFDEDEWKAYKVLKTINENTSDIEKAKIIAKIVNG